MPSLMYEGIARKFLSDGSRVKNMLKHGDFDPQDPIPVNFHTTTMVGIFLGKAILLFLWIN